MSKLVCGVPRRTDRRDSGRVMSVDIVEHVMRMCGGGRAATARGTARARAAPRRPPPALPYRRHRAAARDTRAARRGNSRARPRCVMRAGPYSAVQYTTCTTCTTCSPAHAAAPIARRAARPPRAPHDATHGGRTRRRPCTACVPSAGCARCAVGCAVGGKGRRGGVRGGGCCLCLRV